MMWESPLIGPAHPVESHSLRQNLTLDSVLILKGVRSRRLVVHAMVSMVMRRIPMNRDRIVYNMLYDTSSLASLPPIPKGPTRNCMQIHGA